MHHSSQTVLKIVHVLFWVAFTGLCIKTGAILVSFLVSIFVSPGGAKDLYMGLSLASLYEFHILYYIFIVSSLILLTGLKAYIAYLVLRIFQRFQLTRPFTPGLTELFLKISHISLGSGFLAIIASACSKWISKKGVLISIDWGGPEILFFAGVIYLLAQVFKKGTDLQLENDLTV